MKTRNLITTASLAVLLAACIPSVHPFYTEKDLVNDPRLLGEWEEAGEQSWKFEPAEGKGYKLTITEKENKQGKFDARLLKLKDEFFLDLIATDCEFAKDQADIVGASIFPGHLLVRVTQFAPELKIAFFDFDWLAKHLENNPKALMHHTEDKRILLTASTEELQRFVLAHLGADELFDDSASMARKGDAPTAAAPK